VKKSTAKKSPKSQAAKPASPLKKFESFVEKPKARFKALLQKILKPLDYLFIFRPTLFFPVWIMSVAGYAGFYRFNGELVWWDWSFDPLILVNFLAITVAAGATFIINQLQDIETDKLNRKLFLISENYVQPHTARLIAYYSIAITLVFFLLYDWQIFVTMAGVVLVWGYLYNCKPFVWKDKPVLGMVDNVASGLLLYLTGWALAGYGQWKAFWYAVPYLTAWLAVSALTTIPDMKGDQQTQKKTFALQFGLKGTIWLAVVCLAISFGLGMYFKDPVISLAALLSAPLYLIMLFKPTVAWVLRSIRYPMLFIALALCTIFPWFFVAILGNFYLSRIYYVNRFNLNYPTFQIEEEQHD